ncbi:MAG: hypothetical protein ACI86S_000227 [Paracoccaceae bacterium]|jgi:hypothetical protein
MTHHVPRISRFFEALSRAAHATWSDERGSPAVEFVLIAPFFLLILAATFDIGMILRLKFGLDAQISAAANYGQTRGRAVTDAAAGPFAGEIAALMSGGRTAMDTAVVLNEAARATMIDATLATSDLTGTMAQCYCPTPADGDIQWGTARPCLSSCTDGSTAGRFIELWASTPYISLFGGYGMTEDGTISTHAVVRLE